MTRFRLFKVLLATGLIGIGLVLPAAGQEAETPPAPCSGPEFLQFDFWVGDWDLSWGEKGKGTNSIKRVLDGCVVMEQFDGAPVIKLKGWSFSTYDTDASRWKQTWVDNQGGYLDFVGEFQDGKMILTRNAKFEGKPAVQRMVWYNIGESELDWNWERSLDDGASWEVLWKIHYERRSAKD